MYKRVLMFTVLLLDLTAAGGALAQTPLDLQPPGNQAILLAAMDAPEASAAENQRQHLTTTPKGQNMEPYRERRFTLNTTHKYLGIGSLLLGGLTVLAPKSETGIHHELGKAAAALGGAAVVSGLILHHDDIGLEGGFDNPDNMHALLGGLGAVGFILAADKGPESSHATYGALGGVSMALAIKYSW